MLAVVAQIGAGDAPLRFHDLVADPIQEGPVVADHHQRAGLADQVPLQPLDGFNIQVVGGFVQQQQIRLLQQHLAQGDPHLPAAGVVAHQLFCSLRREADRGQQLVDAGIEFVAVQALEARLQAAQLVDQLIEVVGILGGLLRGHGLLHLPLAVEHLSRLTEGLEQLLAHRVPEVDVELLLQVDDARIPLLHHLTAARFLQAGDDPHLGGFAGPVHAHQADAIARLHLPGDIPEHLTGGVDLRDAFEAEHRAGVQG